MAETATVLGTNSNAKQGKATVNEHPQKMPRCLSESLIILSLLALMIKNYSHMIHKRNLAVEQANSCRGKNTLLEHRAVVITIVTSLVEQGDGDDNASVLLPPAAEPRVLVPPATASGQHSCFTLHLIFNR